MLHDRDPIRIDAGADLPAPLRTLETASAQDRLRALLSLGLKTALVSSFGADSAVLLHIAAQIDPAIPVLFLDTGQLFAETLAYQRALSRHLGLTDLRVIRPDPEALFARDPDGLLHLADPDACCALRKTEPLQRALAPFDAWITGRKRFQSASRARLPVAERDGAGRIKLNPLADWNAAEIARWFETHDLPRHPLVQRGYASIGCSACTTVVRPGEDPRAGRWRGRDKVECGIHFENGRVVRGPYPARDHAAAREGYAEDPAAPVAAVQTKTSPADPAQTGIASAGHAAADRQETPA